MGIKTRKRTGGRDIYLKEIITDKLLKSSDKYNDDKIAESLKRYYELSKKKLNNTLTFQEKQEFAYLSVFFNHIVNDDKKKLKEDCTGETWECFQEQYEKAKALIAKETGKYNIIISKYLELVDKSPYSYNDDEGKFIKYLEYIKKKIRKFKNQLALEDTKQYEVDKSNAFYTDIFKPIPPDFRISDVSNDDLNKINPENFSRFTPEQIGNITVNQLKAIELDRLLYISKEGWDAIADKVNHISIENLMKLNNQAIYKHLNSTMATEMYVKNPDKYVNEFDGDVLNNVSVDFNYTKGEEV